MDLLSILPNFATAPYRHIVPSLEKAHITAVDLVTLDALEIARRAHVPPTDVRRLCAQLIAALHRDIGFQDCQSKPTLTEQLPQTERSTANDATQSLEPGPSTRLDLSPPTRWRAISTLDPVLDALLGGGIPPGYVTEVTGERYC